MYPLVSNQSVDIPESVGNYQDFIGHFNTSIKSYQVFRVTKYYVDARKISLCVMYPGICLLQLLTS